MFENLDIFKISSAMAQHAGQRQALLSENIANADTPEYVARDLSPFKSAYENDGRNLQRASRDSHLNGLRSNGQSTPVEHGLASPNGNTVSIEQEMLKATETIREHDRAIAIYKSALSVLRTATAR